MRTLALFFFVFLLTTATQADDSKATESKDPHHQGILSTVNLGIRFSSVLQRRGVILYDDFQIDPVLAVFLFDDRLEFLGDSLGFRDFVFKDWLRLRTRVVSISDDPIFPSKDSVKNLSVNRPDTYEWANTAEFFLPGYNEDYRAEIDLTWARDISIHHGNYLEAVAKVKLFDFRVPFLGIKIEPNVFSSVGWGDGAHNSYFYGPSANQSGLNNLAYGLWFAFPEEADRFYPIIQIRRFQTLGLSRDGEYVVSKNEGWLFSFIATTQIF